MIEASIACNLVDRRIDNVEHHMHYLILFKSKKNVFEVAFLCIRSHEVDDYNSY